MTWNILTTAPNREPMARDKLRQRGFTVYLPICIQASRTRKAKGRAMPLWPGYLLLAEPDPLDWHSIKGSPGVTGVLCYPDEGFVPAPVPDGYVQSIQRQEDVTGIIVLRKPRLPTFVPEQPVRVVDGPFTGFPATVEVESPGRWVHAAVNIFGRLCAVRFNPQQLAAA